MLKDKSELDGARLFVDSNDGGKEGTATTMTGQKGNTLKGGNGIEIIGSDETTVYDPRNEFGIIEKDEEDESISTSQQPGVEKEIVDEILHTHETQNIDELPIPENIELEIRTFEPEEEIVEGNEKTYENLPPYEPTLDLRDYRYPPLDLLEAHGSEKIVQDPAELENNKNQIINTLKNYDISIQKISATVGPTVTLYEIVPAAGVRISRIKNLEDDIALSPCSPRDTHHCTHSRQRNNWY